MACRVTFHTIAGKTLREECESLWRYPKAATDF